MFRLDVPVGKEEAFNEQSPKKISKRKYEPAYLLLRGHLLLNHYLDIIAQLPYYLNGVVRDLEIRFPSGFVVVHLSQVIFLIHFQSNRLRIMN